MDGIKKIKLEIIVILFIIIGLLLVTKLSFAAVIEVPLTQKVVQLREEQDQIKIDEGEYQQKEKVGDYEVHVYTSPEGDGYHIIRYAPDKIEHFGYGPLAEEYTYTVIPVDGDFSLQHARIIR